MIVLLSFSRAFDESERGELETRRSTASIKPCDGTCGREGE
jgi:hypothetical protein